MAQARVLRYLPTQLSFAVIADKLGISRAAAKERAERAYKKLGVHSRAEAVTRARALGIIDSPGSTLLPRRSGSIQNSPEKRAEIGANGWRLGWTGR